MRTRCSGEYLDLKDRRKLNDEELYCLCSSPNIIRVMKLRIRCVGHVAHLGEMINAYSILLRKPKGKRPLGRPRHRQEHNIKMDLK
jgi:hypothetical protein